MTLTIRRRKSRKWRCMKVNLFVLLSLTSFLIFLSNIVFFHLTRQLHDDHKLGTGRTLLSPAIPDTPDTELVAFDATPGSVSGKAVKQQKNKPGQKRNKKHQQLAYLPNNIRNSAPVLTAFLEPPNTVQNGTLPLPVRNTSAGILKEIRYPQVQRCSNLLENFPVDNYPRGDAFLPWIHDVFPSQDGTMIHFVAQNKRRCQTGEHNLNLLVELQPQVALLQPVSVKRLKSSDKRYNMGEQFRLASYEEADPDGKETRFLCQFHTTMTLQPDNEGKQRTMTTLSVYPYNYEYITWRKDKKSMFSWRGKDRQQNWLSQLVFSCPVPPALHEIIRMGSHIDQRSEQSHIFVDLIPIRTPVRGKNQQYFTPYLIGGKTIGPFNPAEQWGEKHVLPPIEASGRWANIPICHHPLFGSQAPVTRREQSAAAMQHPSTAKKKHRLVLCTWTSSVYSRRGNQISISDNPERLREWIAFHLMVGFEHIYVYDNSPRGQESLEKVTGEFGKSTVTRIPWSCKVCNNNDYNDINPGERSSQYAAEASCLQRYGPHTDWLAFLDTDEYLVPMGKHNDFGSILTAAEQEGLKILEFKSSRALPLLDRLEPFFNDRGTCRKDGDMGSTCLVKKKDELFLNTYLCDVKSPKPASYAAQKKQIYRPDYVLGHFVHYSTVTVDVARAKADTPASESYSRRVDVERLPFARFLDESTEGIMIHARTSTATDLAKRGKSCVRKGANCVAAYPCPDDLPLSPDNLLRNKMSFGPQKQYCNCWINRHVESFWVPRLETEMGRLKS